MNIFDYSKSIVLVTGSSRGLGLSLVQELCTRNAKHIYAGCKTEEGCEYIRSLQLSNVSPILLDVTNSNHMSNIKKSINKLDLLINNAGVASACAYTSPNALAVAETEMKVHFFGALSVVHEVLSLLKQSHESGIINISSIAGISNFKAMGTYSASKSALHFLTQGLRAELSNNGIFVQGVYPGPFDTRLATGFDGPKQSPNQIANIILDSFCEKITEVFPDNFSKSMHDIFLESPKKLDSIFSE